MNICALLSLSRFRLNAGDCDCVLSAARDYSFVRTEPGSANQIRHETDLPELAREAKHRSQFAPRFCICETIDNISQAIDLHKGQNICGSKAFHRDSGRT